MVIWILQKNKYLIGPKIASSFLIALKCTLFWLKEDSKLRHSRIRQKIIDNFQTKTRLLKSNSLVVSIEKVDV